MDRDEALRLLRGGAEGIAEWNRRRGAGEAIPDLTDADLSRDDLRGADLRGANFTKSNLDGAILTGANLVKAILGGARLGGARLDRARLDRAILDGAILDGAILTGARLDGARLDRAILDGAILDGAILDGAILTGAILGGARLDRARLDGAILTGAILDGARLDRARLDGAICDSTIFADVDLSMVEGLDLINHLGPSRISTDTLIRSRGKIPEAFLRGCGLPDAWIDYMPSLIGMMAPIQFYSCFISYSSKDAPFAERLYADLQARGVRCWFAPNDLRIGDRFRLRIDESIRLHDKLLLVLSEAAVTSQEVEAEVEAAMEREKAPGGGTVLFPVRLDDAVMNAPGWPALVRRTRHIGDFTKWKDHDAYQEAFARLLRDLKAEAARGDAEIPG